MIAVLTFIFGALAPFVTKIFDYFERRQAFNQEKEMMELRLKHAAQEHLWKLEEVEAKADAQEAMIVHQPQKSFGVALLDAAAAKGLPLWVLVPAFWLFAAMDALNASVRPIIAYMAVGSYLVVKAYLFQNGALITDIFTEYDLSIVTAVLGYFFGARHFKHRYGSRLRD